MKREKFKNRLIGCLFLVLGALLVLIALANALAVVGCFDTAWNVRELYPWAVSEAELGWESAMYTLEEKQGQWLFGGVAWGFCGLLTLTAGIFLVCRGWKRWREGKI